MRNKLVLLDACCRFSSDLKPGDKQERGEGVGVGGGRMPETREKGSKQSMIIPGCRPLAVPTFSGSHQLTSEDRGFCCLSPRARLLCSEDLTSMAKWDVPTPPPTSWNSFSFHRKAYSQLGLSQIHTTDLWCRHHPASQVPFLARFTPLNTPFPLIRGPRMIWGNQRKVLKGKVSDEVVLQVPGQTLCICGQACTSVGWSKGKG